MAYRTNAATSTNMAGSLPGFKRTDWDLDGLDDKDRAVVLTSVAQDLWMDQQPLREQMFYNARAYDNMPVLGMSPRLYTFRNLSTARTRRTPVNVIRTIVDAYTALVTEDEPKIAWVTDDADFLLQRRAANCEQFVRGVFADQQVYVIAPQCVRDSAIFPYGVVQVLPDESDPENPRVRIERVLPWEVLSDPDEATYGCPGRKYRVRFVEKRNLMAQYPDMADDISRQGLSGFSDVGVGLDALALNEYCAVVEGWSLPYYGRPGRWTTAVGDLLLDDREWARRRFPLIELYKQRPVQGVWPTPLVHDLVPLQAQISRILALFERSIMSIVGHWLVPREGKINLDELDNVVASVIRYSGGARPTFEKGGPLDASTVNYLNWLLQKAYEVAGISEQFAGGKVPKNFSSGKAQLVYADTTSRRFTPSYREYQMFFKTLVEETVHTAAEIAEKFPKYQVKTAGGYLRSTIKFMDAKMDELEYNLELLPANRLSDQLSARLDEIEKLSNAGYISQQDAPRLLEMPDLRSLNNLRDSPYNLVRHTVERIFEFGERGYTAPDSYFGVGDLEQGIQLMREVYWKTQTQRNVPPVVLDLLTRWIDQASSMVEEQTAPQAGDGSAPSPEAGADEMGPEAGGAPPPPGPDGGPPPGEPIQ